MAEGSGRSAELQNAAIVSAVVAWMLETERSNDTAGDAMASAWVRAGHPHHRSWGWNPRAGGSTWQLAGRMDLMRRGPPGHF
jgi:hypothetical protein